jgi:hypothetical protein
MSSTKSKKATKAEIAAENRRKAEIAAENRRDDRWLKSEGATWNLELVLTREGDERVLATLAKYKNLNEFTPDMRRAVLAAARAVLAGIGTKKAARQ